MPAIPTITALFTSVKTATDIAKMLKDAHLSLEKAELKMQIAELISALAEAKINISEVQDAIRRKDDEIRKLKQDLEIEDALEWDPPYYWIKKGDSKDGPFCQCCYDNNKKLVRLIEYPQEKGSWECSVCGKHFIDNTYNSSDFEGFTL